MKTESFYLKFVFCFVYLCRLEDVSSVFMPCLCVPRRVSSIRTTLVSSVGTSSSRVPVNMCALFFSVPVSPWWVTQGPWMKITPSSYFEPREPLCVCMCCHIGARQVDEVMLTLKQAFSTAAALQSNKTEIQLCEACPMHDLHKLCERIEGDSYPRGLVSGIIHEHIDAWGASEGQINKMRKWEDYIAHLCLQVSTHPEQS